VQVNSQTSLRISASVCESSTFHFSMRSKPSEYVSDTIKLSPASKTHLNPPRLGNEVA